MEIKQSLLVLEDILQNYKAAIGKDFNGYRNHCYRVYRICQALTFLTAEEEHKLQIALAFHDLGLFTAETVDYLPPSITLAETFLATQYLEKWQTEIALMIGEHHKVTSFKSRAYLLVEILRQADLDDFSFGIVCHGVDKTLIRQLKRQFPNAGFHRIIAKEQVAWLIKNPLNPFPIFKR